MVIMLLRLRSDPDCATNPKLNHKDVFKILLSTVCVYLSIINMYIPSSYCVTYGIFIYLKQHNTTGVGVMLTDMLKGWNFQF